MNQDKRRLIFERFREKDAEPDTELHYQSPFQLLIAVILSAQATDVSVNLATRELFAVAPTPSEMLDLGVEGLKEYIKTIGLYNAKAENVHNTCRILLAEYNGEIPKTREELERLPGVGRKTANVVLNTAYDHPVIAVDTHIFRVANRTNIARGKDPREVEDRLTKWLPSEFKKGAHHWLILHGRYICTARKPKCYLCDIEDLCEFKDKTPIPE